MNVRTKRFQNAADFFANSGSAWMKLERGAASCVIDDLEKRRVAVSIVEGGIWHEPSFEARLDAIWHSKHDRRPDLSLVESNNTAARQFVDTLPESYNTAIISTFGNQYE